MVIGIIFANSTISENLLVFFFMVGELRARRHEIFHQLSEFNRG